MTSDSLKKYGGEFVAVSSCSATLNHHHHHSPSVSVGCVDVNDLDVDLHPMTLFPNLFPLFVPRRFGPSDLAERIQSERIEMYREKVDLLPAIVTAAFRLGLQVGGEREVFFGGGDDEELLSSMVGCQADCADGSFILAIGTSGLS